MFLLILSLVSAAARQCPSTTDVSQGLLTQQQATHATGGWNACDCIDVQSDSLTSQLGTSTARGYSSGPFMA